MNIAIDGEDAKCSFILDVWIAKDESFNIFVVRALFNFFMFSSSSFNSRISLSFAASWDPTELEYARRGVNLLLTSTKIRFKLYVSCMLTDYGRELGRG